MKLPLTPFWYLRHGETDYNAKGWSQGATEMPLNENGRAQEAVAAPLLVGQGIVAIVSSPMLRTRQTTEIVNAVLKLPVSYEPDLHEVIFGGMEGKPLQPWFTEWMEGRATPEGAESFAELTARVEAAIVGARGPKQVDGWLAAGSLTLTQADMEEIGAVIASSGAGTGPVKPKA